MQWAKRVAWTAVVALAMCAAHGTRAADVVVKKPGAMKTALDLGGLRTSGAPSGPLFLRTLENDLLRSGWFSMAAPGRGVFSVAGTATANGGRLAVTCEVRNTATGRRHLDKRFEEGGDEAARLAHVVADEIVWAVKRRKGIASTRVVMIGSRAGQKDIYMCDSDGGNFLRITRSGAVCLSPNWSPDTERIYYTSFHGGFPDVYMIDLRTYQRQRVAGNPGLNAGACISPDGSTMALTLSKDGNPELYVQSLRSGRLTRLTSTRHAAEASPSWSPDGRSIVFVSDTSGSPQLYVMQRDGGRQSRLTLRGQENVAPDWGADGRIAYSSRRGGRYQICVMDPEDRGEVQLTTGGVDFEDPSWAPDGRHIVCSRTSGYRADLYILDTLGDAPLRLTTVEGDWYSPAWSQK